MKKHLLISASAGVALLGLYLASGSLANNGTGANSSSTRSNGNYSDNTENTNRPTRSGGNRTGASALVEEEEIAPDIGPSIPEQIKEARGIFFNFSCACCGDHFKYAKILEEKGLKWPRIWDDLEDELAFHNLKFREEQAILRILKNPESAVEFMEAQIAFEREKLDTRSARQPWDESRQDGGAGDLVLYREMLQSLGSEKKEALVLENLPAIASSQAHIDATVTEARSEGQEVRLRLYARLADEGLLASSIGGQAALAELFQFTSLQNASEGIPFSDLVAQGFEEPVPQDYTGLTAP